MLCQKCGKKNHALKITRIVNGQAEELNVCRDCAAEISPYHAKLAKKNKHLEKDVEEILKDLMTGADPSSATIIPIKRDVVEDVQCGHCGLSFNKYKQTLMLGCSECYDEFGERLLRDIEKIHGATYHVATDGEGPKAEVLDFQARSRAIKLELEECLEMEDFVRAAQLRDELKKMENAPPESGQE